MLMMDRITEISGDGGEHGKGHVVAEFDITPDLWFFGCHFPGNPIMPGCLGLDGLWQLTGFNLGWRGWQGRGYALGVGEVKLTGMVRPDRKMLRYFVDFTKAIETRRLTMGVANGRVEADGEVIYLVTDMKVALSANLSYGKDTPCVASSSPASASFLPSATCAAEVEASLARGQVRHRLCARLRRAWLSQPGQGPAADRAGGPYRQARPAVHGAGGGL